MKAPPNPVTPIVDREGRPTQVLTDFFSSLTIDPIARLAQLPKPALGGRIMVEDATGGPAPCYGDGSNWRRYSNDAIVS